MKVDFDPVISVIVPIYKVERYLERSVQSVLEQTYENLEIILVDDGSPDSCGEIAEEFAQKDGRVKVIHKKNGGLSDARNAGLKAVTGEYVYFFDSDDLMDQKLLEKSVRPFLESEADLVCFNYYECDERSGERKGTGFREKEYRTNGKGANLVVDEYMGFKLGYCVWNKLYKSSIIKQNKIWFVDNSKIFSEDICFNLYYISYCKQINVISDCLYYYLIRETSIMGQSRKEPRMNQFIEISKAYGMYLKQNYPESVMTRYQEIVFSLLMKLQLGKVSRTEYPKWVKCVDDKHYFYKKSDEAVRNIGKWIECYGFPKGIKKWLGAVEYFCGKESCRWIIFLKKVIFFVKAG